MAELGFIGLGIMGKPMASHLVAAGHMVQVYDLFPEPVKELCTKGAKACRSSKEVAQKSKVIFIMVPDIPDVDAVLFGPDGLAEGVKSGSIVVDMSSISPMATKDFAKRLAAMNKRSSQSNEVRLPMIEGFTSEFHSETTHGYYGYIDDLLYFLSQR